MKRLKLLLFVLLISFPVFAQKTTRPVMKEVRISPEDVKHRRELSADQSVLSLTCGFFEAINKGGQYSESQLRTQRENSRIRLLLYEASRATDQTVKAKMQCANVGGNDAPFYMVVDKGKVKYMGDYIPDGKGGLRLDSLYCDRLNIGTMVARPEDGILDFAPLAPPYNTDKVLILQCKSGTRSFIF